MPSSKSARLPSRAESGPRGQILALLALTRGGLPVYIPQSSAGIPVDQNSPAPF